MEVLEYLHAGFVKCPLAIVGTAVPRVVHARFVSGCENQVFVVFSELGGDLFPVVFLLGRDFGCGTSDGLILDVAGTVENAVFKPAVVPMAVQNGVHAVVDDEIDDGLDGV